MGSAPTILRYYRRLDHFGARVDDRLEVSDDGSLWRWSLAPARAERKDEAGTFRTSLEGDALAELREMAAQVAQAVSASAVPRGHIERTVEIGERLIDLPEPAESSGALGVIGRTLDELADRALESPLAVARLSVRMGSGAAGGQARPVFVFEAVGQEPVRLITPAEGYSLLAVRKEGNREVFRGREEQTTGFIDEDGEMIDGLRRPAVLPAGTRATIVFSGDALDEEASGGRLLATVEGRIGLLGPIADGDFPRTPFRVSVELTS